jgi:hypothetical protein
MTQPPEMACRFKRVFKTAMIAATAAEFLNASAPGPGRTWYHCPACDLWHFRTPKTRRERETVLSHRNAAARRQRSNA